MGTSSDHSGGSGGAWKGAKLASTQFAKHGDRRQAYRALGRLVTALGGAAAVAAGSKAAVLGMQRAGSLLGAARDEGLDVALEQAGMGELVGKPADEVIASLIDLIAGSGEDREGQAARGAACDVLEALAENVESYEDLSTALESVEDLDRVIESFLTSYVYRLLLPVIEERIERLDDLEQRARRDKELREAVAAVVELRVSEGEIDSGAWPDATEDQLRELLEATLRYLEEQDF